MSKSKYKENETKSRFNNSLRDTVVHYGEGAPKRRISPEQEDQLYPGETDPNGSHDGESVQLRLE